MKSSCFSFSVRIGVMLSVLSLVSVANKEEDDDREQSDSTGDGRSDLEDTLAKFLLFVGKLRPC